MFPTQQQANQACPTRQAAQRPANPRAAMTQLQDETRWRSNQRRGLNSAPHVTAFAAYSNQLRRPACDRLAYASNAS